MPSPISKNKPNRRPRSLTGETRPMQMQIPVGIVSVTPAGNTMTIVFNQTVKLTGVPQYAKTGNVLPTAASMTAPNTLVLTYPGGGPEATDIAIPSEEPAIRSASGGYVTPSTFPV